MSDAKHWSPEDLGEPWMGLRRRLLDTYGEWSGDISDQRRVVTQMVGEIVDVLATTPGFMTVSQPLADLHLALTQINSGAFSPLLAVAASPHGGRQLRPLEEYVQAYITAALEILLDSGWDELEAVSKMAEHARGLGYLGRKGKVVGPGTIRSWRTDLDANMRPRVRGLRDELLHHIQTQFENINGRCWPPSKPEADTIVGNIVLLTDLGKIVQAHNSSRLRLAISDGSSG